MYCSNVVDIYVIRTHVPLLSIPGIEPHFSFLCPAPRSSN
jgi:hypothetical protein